MHSANGKFKDLVETCDVYRFWKGETVSLAFCWVHVGDALSAWHTEVSVFAAAAAAAEFGVPTRKFRQLLQMK